MEKICIIFILLNIFFLCLNLYLLNKTNNIKVNKKEEQKQINEEINELTLKKFQLLEEIEKEKSNISLIYQNEKNRINEQIELYKNNLSYASEQYVAVLEKNYKENEEKYFNKIKKLNDEEEQCKKELNKIKESLSAGVQARLREKELKEKTNYYKLKTSKEDLSDIEALNKIKSVLHQPIILSKLIWSTYFQKQTTELCNRIFGAGTKCGIYKITNLISSQVYIGQSVNIQDRIKQHIKCGLGIDAPATNKLYKAMQEDGVWNFSFELMEECPRDQLNEKERQWIEMYQSDKTGYNSTKGNK